MTTPAPANPYKHHRFPGEIISHAIWLYFRFCLSHRDVEELLWLFRYVISASIYYISDPVLSRR
jgi:putative transposase